MSDSCTRCGAKCCRYYCFQIDTPESYEQFEDVRWFLMHHGVTVHIDKGDWYMAIANACKHLTPQNRCGIYEDRPLICRRYSNDSCDNTGGEYEYDKLFRSAEELEQYAREKLGRDDYDAAREAMREKLARRDARKAKQDGKRLKRKDEQKEQALNTKFEYSDSKPARRRKLH